MSSLRQAGPGSYLIAAHTQVVAMQQTAATHRSGETVQGDHGRDERGTGVFATKTAVIYTALAIGHSTTTPAAASTTSPAFTSVRLDRGWADCVCSAAGPAHDERVYRASLAPVGTLDPAALVRFGAPVFVAAGRCLSCALWCCHEGTAAAPRHGAQGRATEGLREEEMEQQRASGEKEAPLSYEQEQLWSLHQLIPEESSGNMCGSVRLRGHLDIDALRESLADFIQRHEIWRTLFPIREVGPCRWCRRRDSGPGQWRT